jgi:hypothetical protein
MYIPSWMLNAAGSKGKMGIRRLFRFEEKKERQSAMPLGAYSTTLSFHGIAVHYYHPIPHPTVPI